MKLSKMLMLATLATVSGALVKPTSAQVAPPLGFVEKLGQEIDVRSGGRIIQDQLAVGTIILPKGGSPVGGGSTVPQIKLRGGNVQVNVPSGDFIQIFDGFSPFVHATQSEVSAAASGRNIVVTYNNSAGIHLSPLPDGSLIIDRVQLSGFAASSDGGQSWKNGFIPPSAGASETFGDPSVGVDRHGVFYFANLAADTVHGTIQVNRSVDGGQTWSDGVVVQEDDGSDKEWLAVGPDPAAKNRDNVYVTWTSFQNDGSCQLRFGRSTDGGVTWAARTIYAPAADPDPTHPQNCLTFSNPVVDPITGSLYVPFLHFSNSNQDFIQMLISDNAGQTFRFATFNVAGAPDPTVMPVTQPGELTDCGGQNLRLTIHDSLKPKVPGLFGLPRYVNASRMILQPALAARNGVLYLAWSNSTSQVFGFIPNSNVLFVSSNDGGRTWSAPLQVNPSDGNIAHVLPSLAIDSNPNSVHITYYTQHSNGTIDLDMANSHDRGVSFPASRNARVTSTSMNLPPTNIPLSDGPDFAATNYDQLIAVCYALGEYQSVTTGNGTVYAGWGDTRNQITEPTNALDPISGQTHSEEDVFFQKVKAQ